MAFYLKRYFGNNSSIHVLNNIRLELKDDAAQIDHLIIHPYGMTIIESKSVHGKVQIKEDGQWVRWYGKQSKGTAWMLQFLVIAIRLGGSSLAPDYRESLLCPSL